MIFRDPGTDIPNGVLNKVSSAHFLHPVVFPRLSARVRGDGEGAGGHGEADDQGQGGRGAERLAGIALPEVGPSEDSCHFLSELIFPLV